VTTANHRWFYRTVKFLKDNYCYYCYYLYIGLGNVVGVEGNVVGSLRVTRRISSGLWFGGFPREILTSVVPGGNTPGNTHPKPRSRRQTPWTF
jgi:hypothetical protein